jgi:mono/diheme cytochrome c family protein
VRRVAIPLAIGLATAAIVFAVLPGDDEDEPAPETSSVPSAAQAPRGRAVFAEMGCGSCHSFRAAGSTADHVDADLDERLANHTEESLRAVIVDPPRGSIMPRDFGRRMSEPELDALVAFLLAGRRP